MNIFRSAALFSAILLLASCGETIKGVGEVIPETRSIEPFNEIQLNGFIDVTFRQIKNSDVDKVVVTAQENLLPYISVKVEDGLLVLEITESIETERDISLEIYGRNIRSLISNGSGDFSSDGKVALQKLYMESNGSGNINLKSDAQSIEVELNGSGDVELDGATDYLEVELNGSGDVEAEDIRAFEVEAQLNGSGDITVFAKESLDAEINGSGDISYKGKAKVTESLNGAGSLKPIN